jgi:DNA-binding Xre family transcriptional regulator
VAQETEETFTDRFNRLTKGLSDGRLAVIMHLSPYAVRKLRQGDTQSLKIETALRLCKALGFSPWELVGDDSHPDEAPPPGLGQQVQSLRNDVADLQGKLADLNERVAPLLERAAAEPQHRGGRPRRRA